VKASVVPPSSTSIARISNPSLATISTPADPDTPNPPGAVSKKQSIGLMPSPSLSVSITSRVNSVPSAPPDQVTSNRSPDVSVPMPSSK
jgi:hypothetical protein